MIGRVAMKEHRLPGNQGAGVIVFVLGKSSSAWPAADGHTVSVSWRTAIEPTQGLRGAAVVAMKSRRF